MYARKSHEKDHFSNHEFRYFSDFLGHFVAKQLKNSNVALWGNFYFKSTRVLSQIQIKWIMLKKRAKRIKTTQCVNYI